MACSFTEHCAGSCARKSQDSGWKYSLLFLAPPSPVQSQPEMTPKPRRPQRGVRLGPEISTSELEESVILLYKGLTRAGRADGTESSNT